MFHEVSEVLRRKVSDTDPEYLEIRNEQLSTSKDQIWGGVELRERRRMQPLLGMADHEISALRGQITEACSEEVRKVLETKIQNLFIQRRQIEQRLQKNDEAFCGLFKNMLRQLLDLGIVKQESEIYSFLINELSNMLSDPSIASELEGYLNLDVDGSISILDLLKKIETGGIPTDLLTRMTERHSLVIEERSKEYERIAEGYKDDFFKAVEGAVLAGRLPISLDTVRRRLDLVVFRLKDRLVDPFGRDLGGHCPSGEIFLSTDGFSKEKRARLRHTVFHELVHEISGSMIKILLTELKDEKAKFSFKEIRHKKSGISIHDKNSFKRFEWLNEAITEWIALRLSGYADDRPGFYYRDSDAYPQERKELDRLFDAGLQEDVVLRGYFENIETSQESAAKKEYFADLVRSINKVENDEAAFFSFGESVPFEKNFR